MNKRESIYKYFEDISFYPKLSTEEQTELAIKAKNGDIESVNKLIESCLKLVVNIAKKYNSTSMSMADLIQEGNLALYDAIDKFDPSKGYKFSTYATFWIRKAISFAVMTKTRIVHYSRNSLEDYHRVRKVELTLANKLGRNPSDEEIAEHCDISVQRVVKAKEITQDARSLDVEIGEEDTSELKKMIVDNNAVDPTQNIATIELKQTLENLMSTYLNEREKQIIELRYGLNGKESMTFVDISKLFGLSKQRVRQIEQDSLKKLNKKSNLLKDFI